MVASSIVSSTLAPASFYCLHEFKRLATFPTSYVSLLPVRPYFVTS